MKRLALTAAGAAVLGLTACSGSAAPAAAPSSSGPGAVPTAVSATCSQQYHAWERGPGKGLIAALDAVGSVGTATDAHVLTVSLRHARLVVARATRHPVPGCADPRGYWNVLLMHVNAAAASKASPSSVRAAMKGVPMIEHQLTAELEGTSG
jgi:hypothetical protein